MQIESSLTEMKLQHCEALYHSLLRQQHDLQGQFNTLRTELATAQTGVVDDEVIKAQAETAIADRDRVVAALEEAQANLAAEVQTLKRELAQESEAREELVREIKSRDHAIRDLRGKVVAFAQRAM